VRAQVDCDLTTVSWVDRLLGLIKNLGRHSWSVSRTTTISSSCCLGLGVVSSWTWDFQARIGLTGVPYQSN
jgi:hypothetical protein